MSGYARNSPLKKCTEERSVIGCDTPNRGLTVTLTFGSFIGAFCKRCGVSYIGDTE